MPDCSQFQQTVDALAASFNDDMAFCDGLGPRHIQVCRQGVRARLQEARDQLARCQQGLPPFDLTGAWASDDGGIYLLRQVGSAVWWAGLSTESPSGGDDFHLGLSFSNVFVGTVTSTSINGDWADVPKGTAFNSGSIVLDIRSSTELTRQSATGGFGGARWTKASLPVPIDVLTRGAQVRRNDNGAMGGLDPDGMDPEGHLKFYKDNVVVYGMVTRDIQVNCPINGSRRYANFMCNADGNFDDSDLDGDLTFEMTVDRNPSENTLRMALDSQPGFWTDEWLNDPNEIKSKLDASGNRLHDVELIMYGRPAGKPPPGGNCDGNVKPLLPGWMELSANGILYQGRPIENNVLIYQGSPGRIFDRSLPPQTRIRVTGMLALDCHGWLNECGEGESANNNVEIHPVYSLEIIEPTQRPELTGVWGASDAGTYYIRQVGTHVWWLGLSRDRGRTFTNVFSGELVTASDGSVSVEGSWGDVPFGITRNSGQLRMQLPEANTLVRAGETGGFGGTRWEKMYESNVAPTPVG